MNQKLPRSKGNALLTGAVMLVLGVVVLVNPIGALETLTRMIGWVLIAYGVLAIAPFFLARDKARELTTDVGMPAIVAVVGLVMAIFPSFVLSIIWTIIGAFILITGILDIIEAKPMREMGGAFGVLATGSGVLCVVLGILVICVPLASPTLAMLVAAIALIINGITEIIFALGR